MIIKSFSITHKNSIREKVFSFDDKIEYFFSESNSVGKTTFLRAILFCLGFQIPSTKNVRFEHYTFELNLVKDDGENLRIKRNNNVLNINGMDFNPQTESASIIKRVFGIDNDDLAKNFLAVIYIDQDKGWTLLNRGKVVGANSFNVESFLRGLDDNDVVELKARLEKVLKDISRYSLMHDVAEYQKTLAEHKEEIVEVSYDETVMAELGILENKIAQLDKEIRYLNSVKANNSAFVDYITKLGLQVEVGGKAVIINKNNLLNYNDIQIINDLRLLKLKSEKNDLITKREHLHERIKPTQLFETKSAIESFDEAISRNKIDQLQVQSTLDSLNKEKDSLRKSILNKTIEDNRWINILNSYIEEYWRLMDVELQYKPTFLLTRDLKSLSGALFYKVIIIFKLAFMRALRERTGLVFPIFVDSPSGREVSKETVEKALGLIKRDFSNHQIFISSVVDYEHIFGCNNGSKLVFDGLRAFDPVTLFDETN